MMEYSCEQFNVKNVLQKQLSLVCSYAILLNTYVHARSRNVLIHLIVMTGIVLR